MIDLIDRLRNYDEVYRDDVERLLTAAADRIDALEAQLAASQPAPCSYPLCQSEAEQHRLGREIIADMIGEPAQGDLLAIALEALDRLARLGNQPNFGNSLGNDIARQALTAIEIAQPAQGDDFCDAHCTWRDHHPECTRR